MMKINELLTKVAGILGISEQEVMNTSYVQTIEQLVEVIERGTDVSND